MYTAAARGIEMLKEYDLSQYTPAMILLTDGQSGGSIYDFESAYAELGSPAGSVSAALAVMRAPE